MNRKAMGSLVAAVLLGWAGGASGAGPWYVATNGNGSAGTSWATAYTNLQQALDAAQAGDTIYVAGHTFGYNTTVQQQSQLVWTNKGLTILGGYAADGGTPGALTNTPTLLSQPASGTSRILYVSNVTNGSLQRVTIAGGNLSSGSGGGMYITGCTNLAFVACLITNNMVSAGGAGGNGIYVVGANSYVSFTNCLVQQNISNGTGGGPKQGGGMYISSGTVRMDDSLVARNRIAPSGNTSGSGAGAYVNSGALILRNCLVFGNEANYESGATAVADSYGDGLYLSSGTMVLQNCTVAYNLGEGIRQAGGTLSVSNSIVWGNFNRDIVGTVSLVYCDIQDGTGNGLNGCISADPLFQNGFYLNPVSPCVNTGNVTAAAAGLDARTTRTDATPDSGAVDLGYHYATGFDLTYADIYVATNGDNTLNNGTNALTPFRTIAKALTTAVDGSRIHIAAGSYTNGSETFPLAISGKIGVQLLGTNSATTVINASGANQRVLNMLDASGSTRLENLTLTGGSSGNGWGGALYLELAANVTLASCSLINNNCSSGSYGMGIGALDSGLTITNCLIKGNVSSTSTTGNRQGGGICAYYGSLTMRDSLLANNRILPATSPSGCIGAGGGLYQNGGSATLSDCLLYGNDANYDGITTISQGDGVYLSAGSMCLNNCTVAYNVGNGIYRAGGTLSVSNSIVWGQSQDIVGSVSLVYCDVQDGTGNGVNGCFSSDPLFQNGYYLNPGSPCVDHGNVTAAAAGLDARTTRTDAMLDSSTVDLGYHYASGFDLTYADIYVATNGSDSGNNGINAASPFRTITKALGATVDGTRIHIAAGSYTNGSETFPLTLSGKNGVQLLGTNRNATVVNAAGANQRVLFLSTLGGATRVEGLTLTGGNGGNGGGVWVDGCGGLTFATCSITNNSSNGGTLGQGVYVQGCALTMTNSRIEKSFSSQNGGGGKVGGGLYLRCTDALIGESVVVNNTMNPSPGTTGNGGGIYLNAGTVTLRNCLVYGNDAAIPSSGCQGYGDGIYLAAGAMSVLNCTIVTNLGFGVDNGKPPSSDPGGTLAVTNSIVWLNGQDSTGTVTLAWSDVGVWDSAATRTNCISADPLFKSAATNDFRLQLKSPCINAGTNLNWMTGALDLAGAPRIQNKSVDMGAYETTVPAGGMAIMFR